VALIVILLDHHSGNRIDWAEVVALALIIPTVGSVGLAWSLRQKSQQSSSEREL
jgi:hypothetical protein